MNPKIKKYLNEKIDSKLIGKTVLITGANSGIGFEIANETLYLGGNVIMACRNLLKAENAKSILLKQNPYGNVKIIQLDLSDFNSIKKCVSEIEQLENKPDFIVNNAGVFGIKKSLTKQGKEIVIGTNLLGTYLFTKFCIQQLSNDNHKIHFIFTTSITAHLFKINYDDPYLEKHHYGKFKIYGSSKLGIIHLYEYFKTICDKEKMSFSLTHPGITYTPLIDKAYSKNWFRKLAKFGMKIIFHSSEKAALCTINILTKDENNSYYGPRGLFGISGYPKKKRLPKKLIKNYQETIKFVNNEIII